MVALQAPRTTLTGKEVWGCSWRPDGGGSHVFRQRGDWPVVVVLLHGVLTGSSLWDTVVQGLRARYRYLISEFLLH